jgi:hypothetical protein
MASTNDVVFPESMAYILANPIDIYFGSMLAKSTTPALCLLIESNALTSNQQIGKNLSMETHPPTPRELIAGSQNLLVSVLDRQTYQGVPEVVDCAVRIMIG